MFLYGTVQYGTVVRYSAVQCPYSLARSFPHSLSPFTAFTQTDYTDFEAMLSGGVPTSADSLGHAVAEKKLAKRAEKKVTVGFGSS